MGLTGAQWEVWQHLQHLLATGQRICEASIRALHKAVGRSRSTVELAIKALNALGIIRTRPGDRSHPSQHEMLRSITISEDTPTPKNRDTEPIGTPNRDTQSANRDTQSGHLAAPVCAVCAARLQQDARASVIDETPRARLTTDRHFNETNNKQVSQSLVLDWVTDHCGPIGRDLRCRFEVAIERSHEPQELITRFFESKWPDILDRYRQGRLPYVSAGLFCKALWEGEIRAWKNLNREELAREARWNEQVAEAEEYRKGMASAQVDLGELDAVLRDLGVKRA